MVFLMAGMERRLLWQVDRFFCSVELKVEVGTWAKDCLLNPSLSRCTFSPQ